jgi:hypothetical protein
VKYLGGLATKFKIPSPAGHTNGKLLCVVLQPSKGTVTKNYFYGN